MRWDVFCRVVDNYGDAGVCWRVARQLAAEHAIDATLWLDRLATLAHFEPSLDPRLATQTCRGVIVRQFDDASNAALPDVVVEGFGCGLPPRYAAALGGRDPPPLWINLEYLSAEPWVESVHGIASPQPHGRLTRYFWFPGFTAGTGGLIREAGLLRARAQWQARHAQNRDAGALRIALFCYPNRALPALLDAWSEADESVVCTIPEGVATAALDRWLRGDVPHAGQSARRGRLAIDVVPFATQEAFDRLLWGNGVNFVRGEDSFVRAQWAARPFVWQPYPQDENAHRLKLDAFLARYAATLAPEPREATTSFWQAWSGEDGEATAAAWPAFRASLSALEEHGERWARDLAALPEMTAGLVRFARSRL